MLPRPLLSCVLLFTLASYGQAGTWYVKRNAGAGGDGLSWLTAYQRVQDALAVAQSGDQVWVAKGIYRPGEYSSPRSVTFTIPPGVSLYGGFDGSETALAQRNWIANETILSGDLHLDDTPGFGNRGENCYHVVEILQSCCFTSPTTLDGFSIVGGNANGTLLQADGGGIFADTIYWAELVHLSIRDNQGGQGGGIFSGDGSLHLSDCELRGNQAATGGGGFFFSDLRMTNSIVQGNVATAGVGGIMVQDGNSQFYQSIIAWNQGTSVGGVVTCCAFEAASFSNSILWGNSGSTGTTATDQVEFFAQQFLLATDIQGDPANIDLDPLWVDALGPDGIAGTGDEDFHLSCVSPLIDRGDNSGIPAGLLLDYEDHPRQVDDPAVPDTGSGGAPIVDLGPYEFACGCNEAQNYCSALPNSSGTPAAISWSGSTSLFASSMVLSASGAPPLKNGLFFYGSARVNLPWGDGIRCAGGSLQRLGVLQTDAGGNASLPLDFTQPPLSSGPHALLPGAQWNFQFFFRDPSGGPAGWNTTDALAVRFCP